MARWWSWAPRMGTFLRFIWKLFGSPKRDWTMLRRFPREVPLVRVTSPRRFISVGTLTYTLMLAGPPARGVAPAVEKEGLRGVAKEGLPRSALGGGGRDCGVGDAPPRRTAKAPAEAAGAAVCCRSWSCSRRLCC